MKDINEIKEYPIVDILQELGFPFEPQKDKHYYGMFISPFRDEKEASFKIDYTKNLWYDFGQGRGGDNISLVQYLKRCNFTQAKEYITNFCCQEHSEAKTPMNLLHSDNGQKDQGGIEIHSVKEVFFFPLKNYIKERHIPVELAVRFCKEVIYINKGKTYFSLAFKNNAGGFVLRNKNFKGNTISALTTIAANNNTCSNNVKSATVRIYEGFFNFLSDLVLKNESLPITDIIVLNSVNNVKSALNYIFEHQICECYLDNDVAGRKALEKIKEAAKEKKIDVRDMSFSYSDCNDLNEYLIKNNQQEITNSLKIKNYAT
ncbi:MAG: toprim domain-containing protein [Bacteroidales bacterium]